MKFFSRRWVLPNDLNPNQTLFGGQLLKWIDEEAGMYAIIKLGSPQIVTRYISEISFLSAPKVGDIIEIGMEPLSVGTSSLTFRAVVRNLMTQKTIIEIDKIVMVHVNEEGRPAPHNKTLETLNSRKEDSDFCS